MCDVLFRREEQVALLKTRRFSYRMLAVDPGIASCHTRRVRNAASRLRCTLILGTGLRPCVGWQYNEWGNKDVGVNVNSDMRATRGNGSLEMYRVSACRHKEGSDGSLGGSA